MLPSIFIGSSREGLNVARAVQQQLRYDADATIWSQGVFGLGQGTLEALVDALGKFDFAVLVLTADDLVQSRGHSMQAPRDNVLLELGMFLGRLGRNRAFALFSEEDRPKLPSDLAGTTLATYRIPADGNLQAGVGPACADLLNCIRALGKLGSSTSVEHPLRPSLVAIAANVERAMLIDHRAFHDEIASKCNEWRAVSSEWAKRHIVVRDNYLRLLLDVYRTAKKSVFSTSVPEYRRMWLSPTGRQILDVHRANHDASSTRVFIFDRRSDVTTDDQDLFREQLKAGVAVRLYFDDEDRIFLFPADLGRDWTIVDDGRAIGVTRNIADYCEARWYFDEEDQIARFLDYRKNLLQNSIPVEEFIGPTLTP